MTLDPTPTHEATVVPSDTVAADTGSAMAEVVLSAERLGQVYRVRNGWLGQSLPLRAVHEVSLSLRRGETLAVVGESGCGKSTLARMLALIEPPGSGSFTLCGHRIEAGQRHFPQALHRLVQVVFQNPYASLNPRKTIAASLEEPLLLNTTLDHRERRTRVLEMLEQVGLRASMAQRYPHMFSGGQRQRVAIARALILKPQVLVLDEAVAALDVSVQAQILNLLDSLQREFALAYVFISHSLAVVRHFADHVLVMYLGSVVESAPAVQLFAEPLHPYTQTLLSATPMLDEQPGRRQRIVPKGEPPSPLNPPSGCCFHPRCHRAVAACAQSVPMLQGEGQHLAACLRIGEP